MLNKILAKFGYRLVSLKNNVQVPDVVAAFAMEIQDYVPYYTRSGYFDTAYSAFGALRAETHFLEEYVYADTIRPELVRLAATRAGAIALHLAQKYGELLPRASDRCECGNCSYPDHFEGKQ